MIVIGGLQQTPEERLDIHDFKVLSAHFVSPHRPCDTIGFQAKILHLKSGYSGKHRIPITHIAHFWIAKKRATLFGLKRHHTVCMRHIEGPQDPFLGRLLEPADDDHPGASEAAVLSWSAWKSDFGADPNILGTMVRIDKHPYTIVGVTPEGFYGTEKIAQTDIFVPMANEASLDGFNWLESRSYKNLFSIVRMKDGVTMPQVRAELNTIAARIAQQHPKEEEASAFKLARPGLVGDFVGGPVRGFLAGVMVLAGIVLLAACANLGSLFAARTADRAREIAIRMALGSSRW